MAKKADADKVLSPDELSKEFQEYSVAEFFKRNRQMLGYTGKVRSLTTVVHEYVTNSLDASEDAKVLPELLVEVVSLPDGHYKVVSEDNGTGIPKQNVGQALGKLLAGTKFMQRQQKRGQQGIGACMRSDTLVPLADGRVLPIKQIVDENMAGELVLALDLDSFKLVPAKIKQCVRVTNPYFVRLRLQKGREIFLTPENPVLTVRGGKPEWIRADAVKRGERIAAPVVLKQFYETARVSALSFLGDDSLEVGDCELVLQVQAALSQKYGRIAGIAAATGFNKDVLRNWFVRKMPNGRPRGHPSVAQLVALAEKAGINAAAIRDNVTIVGRCGTFVNLPRVLNEDLFWLAGFLAGDGHITREDDNKWGVGISATGNDRALIDLFCLKMSELFGVKYSVLYNSEKHYYFAQTSSAVAARLFEKLGIKRGRKFDSFDVPNAVMAADNRLLAAYLRGIFDAEGSISPRIRAVTLMIHNRRALEKISLALLRLGVVPSFNQCGAQFRIMVCGKENVLRFAERVGFSNPAKNQLLEAIAASIVTRYAPTQVVPGMHEVVAAAVSASGVKPSGMPAAARSALKTGVVTKLVLEQVCRVVSERHSKELYKWADADVDWLAVTRTELVDNAEEFVYDLEVEGHHNFVAGGMIAHNSYATLFSQITTGRETHVKTSSGDYKVFECDVSIDINKNESVLHNQREYSAKFRGTRIEVELSEVEYNRGSYGPFEYLRRTAIANPHAQITLVEPNKEITAFPRASNDMPVKPKKVLPHPLGVTTSDLMDMSGVSPSRKISSMLQNEFSRLSAEKVKEVSSLCPGVDLERAPRNLQWQEAEKIVQAFQKVKWIAPETDALQPIGSSQLVKSLKNLLAPEELRVVERSPKVFRGGIPFMVEAAIAYGGNAGAVDTDGKPAGKGEVMRFANRVPLLFDAGNCAIVEAVKTIDWSRYDLKEWESMPLTVFVNFTSVYVPYTGAGKLAIAAEEEIVAEIRNALMECARGIAMYLHTLRRAEEQEHRRIIFFKYLGEVAQALSEVTGREKAVLMEKLRKIAEERTSLLEAAEADAEEELDTLEKAASKAMVEDKEEEAG